MDGSVYNTMNIIFILGCTISALIALPSSAYAQNIPYIPLLDQNGGFTVCYNGYHLVSKYACCPIASTYQNGYCYNKNAQTSNGTSLLTLFSIFSHNDTNTLLKQLIKIENTTQTLQQSNANVIATKLDHIITELQNITHTNTKAPIMNNLTSK